MEEINRRIEKMKMLDKTQLEILLKQGMVKDINENHFGLVRTYEGTLVYFIDREYLEKRFTRIFYANLLLEFEPESEFGRINKMIEAIIQGSAESLPEELDLSKLEKRVKEAVDKSIDYYLKTINKMLSEMMDIYFDQTYLRTKMDLRDKSQINQPTETQIFNFFIKKQVEKIKSLMNIKPERGNKNKRDEKELLKIQKVYKSYLDELQFAYKQLKAFWKDKEKQRSRIDSKTWNKREKNIMNMFPRFEPEFLRKLRLKGENPCLLARQLVSRDFKLGSTENVKTVLRDAALVNSALKEKSRSPL